MSIFNLSKKVLVTDKIFGGKCRSDSPNHMIDEIARKREREREGEKRVKGGATSLEYRRFKCL